MNNIPVFQAKIIDGNDGVFCISLVDMPATEVNWQCFDKEKERVRFAIQNDEEHILAGVVMIADTPIYRINEMGEEYYIKYSKDVIKKMAEKMLKDQTFNNIDLQHDGQLLPYGMVSLRELFIKDEAKGIVPNYLDVPDGSLIALYKIHDDELWQECKSGTFNGFSLEGFFQVEQEKMAKQNKNKNMFEKIKEKLRAVLAEFTKVTSDKGDIYYDGEELKEGVEVSDESGNAIADGEYTVDGKTYTVKDGKVESVKDAEVTEDENGGENTETGTTEEVNAEDETPAENTETGTTDTETGTTENAPADQTNDIEALKADMEALKAEVETLKAKLAEIETTPAEEPVIEEFSKVMARSNSNAVKMAGAWRNK